MQAFFRTVGWMAVLWMTVCTPLAQAQDRQGNFGLGAQAGEPYGVTLRWYYTQQTVFETLASWEFDGEFALNIHQLAERRLEDSPLNFSWGPGLLIGRREQPDAKDLLLGVSSRFGVNFFSGDFEVFLHLTPRLNVIINPRAELDGGIGLRYYLRRKK